MACIDEIICLGEVCSCGDTVELNLIATESGLYQMFARFNGVNIVRNVTFISGDKIVIPNVFNENYLHHIYFLDTDGEKYQDKVFSLTTKICISPESAPPLPPADETNSILVVANEDNVIVDNRLIGKVVTGYMINDFSKNTDFIKSINSNTFSVINGTEFYAGDAITIIFE